MEIHQNVGGDEIVDTVPDLREFDAKEHSLQTVVFDGETLIPMNPGDYLVYYPSSSEKAKEMPIEPYEGTIPGFIYDPVPSLFDGLYIVNFVLL